MAALAAIRNKDVSTRELTLYFLEKAETANASTDALREILFDQALDAATAIDAELTRGNEIGPLCGLPVVVKENCDLAGCICSAGLSFRSNHRPDIDAAIVKRLRQAGAVIIGTSVSDPGAFSTRTLEVTHPINPDLTVGGSSGGSGAALRAGMCLGAIGTDTGGSIRIPAACCGVVGLKPTFGAFRMDGIFPLVPSLDHAGPMARSVAETEILWAGLSGQSAVRPCKPQIIGYDPSWLQEADQGVQDAFSLFLSACVELGVPTKPVTLPDLDDVSDTHGTLFLDEALTWHMRSFADQRTEYPTIAQTWFDLAEQADPKAVLNAKDHRKRLTATLGAILSEVDFIATPTLLQAAIPRIAETIEIAGQTLETTMAMVRTTSLFNHTGHPAIALPIGSMKDGAQASLQLVAARSQETALLRMANNIQSHFVELARTIPTPKP